MSDFSDTLTIGLVLILLFGSIVLYLYTRIQQNEQKVSLLESILLDLKMSAEIQSYTELPADTTPIASTEQPEVYTPYHEEGPAENSNESLINIAEELTEVEQYKSVIDDAVNDTVNDTTTDSTIVHDEFHNEVQDATPSVNYDVMTLKDLQALAKSRGITGAGTMKKGAVMEALKTSDRSAALKPGSLGSVGSNSFLETSASFSNESA
jgi:hypothetical protein